MKDLPSYEFSEFFETTGNWTCPDEVSEVVFVAAGGGSGGNSGGVGGSTTIVGDGVNLTFAGGASSSTNGNSSGGLGRGSQFPTQPFSYAGGLGKRRQDPSQGAGASGALVNGGNGGSASTTVTPYEGGPSVGKPVWIQVTPGEVYALTIGTGGAGGTSAGGGAGGFVAILYNK